MSWEASDSDIEAKFTELIDREKILNTQLGQIRKYQRAINSLKMIPASALQDVVVDEKTVQQIVTTFSLPANFAGNEINSVYRDSQKAELIVNINAFLGE